MSAIRQVRLTSLGGITWETTARITLTDHGSMGSVPWYRVTYTNEFGERVSDVRGLSVVECRDLAQAGHGPDSPQAFDTALAGALSSAVSLFQDYNGRHAVILEVKSPRAKFWRTLTRVGARKGGE